MAAAAPATPSSALLVVPQRIGDVLLATPIIASLKRKWPALSIDVLVFKGTEGVLSGNPQIREVLAIDHRLPARDHLRLFSRIWRRYDISVSTMCGDRPTLYAWAASKFSVGPILAASRNQGWKRVLLARHLPFDDLGTHTVAMGLKIAALVGVDPYPEVQVNWLTEDEQVALRIVRETLQDAPFTVLHPTPKFNYKKWYSNGWRELADWLANQGLKIVLTGSANPEEGDYLDKIFPRLPPSIINVAGKLNFGALAALLKRASLYVGPDTVVTHMAAALGVPTVALFGPSNPVKWGPWPRGCNAYPSPYRFRGTQFVGNVALVQGAGHCVPCLQEGCARHEGSESVCLQMLAAGTVIEAAENLLARTRVLSDSVIERLSD